MTVGSVKNVNDVGSAVIDNVSVSVSVSRSQDFLSIELPGVKFQDMRMHFVCKFNL
jgi:hypothetical protein